MDSAHYSIRSGVFCRHARLEEREMSEQVWLLCRECGHTHPTNSECVTWAGVEYDTDCGPALRLMSVLPQVDPHWQSGGNHRAYCVDCGTPLLLSAVCPRCSLETLQQQAV